MINNKKYLTLMVSAIVTVSMLIGVAQAGTWVDSGDPMIVVQVSTHDERAQARTLKRLAWIVDDFGGKATIEVVAVGPAFNMLEKGGKYSKKVAKLIKKGVVFTADASIQKMMKKHKLPTDLVGGVKHVKIGPAHIVRLQMQGYKYLTMFF